MTKYTRPYCSSCNVVYSIYAAGRLQICPHCGSPLEYKSFSPWPKIGGGIAIICAGVGLVFTPLPFFWIGAFIWGGSLIHNARKRWQQVKALDLEFETFMHSQAKNNASKESAYDSQGRNNDWDGTYDKSDSEFTEINGDSE
jgi:hypothetical protein